MRQSREELIKRGVLKEIYDKGKRQTAVHSPGPSRVYLVLARFVFCFVHRFIKCYSKTW